MILITGGAGFIGSNLQAAFQRRGHETAVVDRLGTRDKWRNLAKHPPDRLVHPSELDAFLSTRPPIEMVFHLGAISDTTATDGDQTWATNVELTRRLWEWCGDRGVRRRIEQHRPLGRLAGARQIEDARGIFRIEQLDVGAHK